MTVAMATTTTAAMTTTMGADDVVASTRSVETIEGVAVVGEGDADADAAATSQGASGGAERAESEDARAEETFDDAVEAHDDDEDEDKDEEVEEIVVGGPPDLSALQRSGELSRELQDEEEEEEEEISRGEALAAAVELIKAIADGSEPLDAGKLGSLLWAVSNRCWKT